MHASRVESRPACLYNEELFHLNNHNYVESSKQAATRGRREASLCDEEESFQSYNQYDKSYGHYTEFNGHAVDHDSEFDDPMDDNHEGDSNRSALPGPSERRCAACHRLGHSRRTSHLCPFYVPKQPHQGEKLPRALPRCSSCHQQGHKKDSPHCPNHIPMAGIARRQEFNQDLVYGKDVDQGRHYMKPMVQCNKCGAFMYDQECVGGPVGNRTFTQCCGNGAISLPHLSFIPKIVDILGRGTNESVRFRSRSRKYNAVLSFTSMGVNVDERLASGRGGVYTFRICGQVVHRIGAFLPVHGHQPVSPRYTCLLYTSDAADD